MKLMLVGGGGREHAILKKLRENPLVTEVFALPGNGGMEGEAVCVPVTATDIEGLVRFAKETGIDYAVVTPDDPLVLGAVNALEAEGIPCFGPRSEAAVIEGSKSFAKELMRKYGIPTADCKIFRDPDEALAYVAEAPLPVVVKADGLALGKGVVIAHSREEAEEAVKAAMCEKKFGKSGETLVIEEFLEGPEVSVLALTDGETLLPLPSSMDHKAAYDGDKGPNTGGMGTVAPNPFYTEEVAKECMERIFLPTVRAMKAEGRRFKGCLYFGLMITKDGPKVIEYNCRFGDPETQVVLPLVESDLFGLMRAVTEERLAGETLKIRKGAAACVVLASEGYPLSYRKGFPITLPEDLKAHVCAAGVKLTPEGPVTNGGRVLGVTAVGETLREALETAYGRADRIRFENKYCRRDIGARALKEEER